jgi:hypothetical protein
MTPADRRITELIDKWLKSIDLHLKYAELSDVDYACAQKWPKHDRPTRWVLEVAKQKILELKSQCESRQQMGDGKFAESLELMAFLANLVGIQHIQRFIPLADGSGPVVSSTSQTVEASAIKAGTARAKAPNTDESTREMPRLKAIPAKPAAAVPVLKPAAMARSEPPKPVARPAAPVKGEAVAKSGPTDLKGKIIADAVRLMKWGKPWHELAELIGRIADRPSVPEIRKVLRTHKTEIEAQAVRAKS